MINENVPTGKKNKALPIIIAIIAVLILALIVVLAMNSNSSKTTEKNNPQAGQTSQNKDQSQTNNQGSNTGDPAVGTDDGMVFPGDNEDGEPVAGEGISPEQQALAEGREVVEGANKISKDNEVLSVDGKVAKNDVRPLAPEAPRQTAPLENTDELSEEVIKITMTAQGINPETFTVSANSPVSLAVTAGDEWGHIFKFNDPQLSAVAVGLIPGETRAITFQAPVTPGEYSIYCDVPGHANRGETAVMVVE